MRRVRVALFLGFCFITFISLTPLSTNRTNSRRIHQRTDERLIIPRPGLGKIVDVNTINSICRGSSSGLERIREVASCLSYFAASENKMLVDRVETSDEPVDGKVSQRKQSDSISAEILIYHTYWSGTPTWRVEFFLKSYLFTQNLGYSQIWLWLDEDTDPEALRHWNASETGKRLQPLVDSGHLLILPWRLPQRVRVPPDMDHTDGIGYLRKKGRYPYPDADVIADGIIRDPAGEAWVLFYSRYTQAALSPVVRSDIHRFVVLHLFGGVYLDIDVLLLRDLRPLWNPDKGFAERWSVFAGQGDINTAVFSLPAMSEISSYFLRMGMRLGLNFHPRVLGNLAHKDGRMKAINVFESALFDPAWPEQQQAREGPCTAPCFKTFQDFFQTPIQDGGPNWSNEDANRMKPFEAEQGFPPGKEHRRQWVNQFFQGAYAYHIHNQWTTEPKSNSWAAAFRATYDQFFERSTMNVYGERWEGPKLLGFCGDQGSVQSSYVVV